MVKDGYAFDVSDDASLIWLDPALQKQDYAAALADLQANATALGIQRILTRAELTQLFRDFFSSSRTPDFFVVSQKGVIYTGGSKLAEHGGAADDDRHVALLVSASGLEGQTEGRTVATTQIAPTILWALGLSQDELQAVRNEGTRTLPGLFY